MADETIDELAQRIAGVSYASAEQRLIDIYRFAHMQILEAIERAIHARADRVPTQLQQLLNMVTRQYQTALVRSAQWTGTQLPEAFNAGMQIAETRLQYQGITQLRTSFREINLGAVEASARETMNDLLRATTLTEDSVKARVRRVMLEETRMMAATGMRPKEQAKVIAERMAEDGVFGITARNGRHIPMDEYARIVGHTKLRQVHTEGTINLVTENGLDLVQITTHLHKPDACSPLEGKVYSLTGKTPGWPVLPKRTPFHIGCKHVTTPFVPTFRSKDDLARIQEESNRPGQITVYSQERLDKLEADRKKRDRFLRVKRQLRADDEAAVLAGTKDAPKDMKAYERSLTARANARVRSMKVRALASESGPRRGYSVKPEPEDLHTVTVKHGDRQIEVRDAWATTNEARNVQQAFERVHPRFSKDLTRVEFVNDLTRDGQTLRGNYNVPDRIMTLNRGADRNWAVGSPKTMSDAQATVLHEFAHHVYNVSIDPSWRDEWKALANLTGNETIVQVQELFADQFSAHFAGAGNAPSLRAFFDRFRP